jgi:arylsulfatase A-like enzyme
MKKISRRDFLKLGLGLFEAALVSNLTSTSVSAHKPGNPLPNIVLLVCDAMTARNLSLYGYPRKTTPNLEKLAEHAFVYHNHYAGGNYTTPGTATLLTGLTVLTHRAITQSATVRSKLSKHNIFNFLGHDYFKMGYGQNYWANYLLQQFSADIDSLLPFSEFGLVDEGIVNNRNFKNDLVSSSRALEKMLYYGDSLLLSFITDLYYQPKVSASRTGYPQGFPQAPVQHNIFTMEALFSGVENTIVELDARESPFFSYFHIFPPHNPYSAQKDFAGMFDNDGYQPIVKHNHVLSKDTPQSILDDERNKYDAYLANLDFELGGLMERLKAQGILDHTYFIITSDHGEMFERGMHGHAATPLLYEPIIRVPLMVFVPENQTRRDILSLTGNVDILPTILNWAKQTAPASCEGSILPGLGGQEEPDRSVIIAEAVESSAFTPFTKATYVILKGKYKLIYYHGYQNKYQDCFEFYDLQEDPEELRDKYSKPKFTVIISDLKKELFAAIEKANMTLL